MSSNSSKSSEPQPCPEAKANALSKITFWWANGFLKLGSKRPLEQSDIYKVPDRFLTPNLYVKFNRSWKAQLDKNPDHPSLVRAIAGSIGTTWYAAGPVRLVADACNIVSPLLLRSFITHLKGAGAAQDGYMLAGGLFLLQICVTLFINGYFMIVMIRGMCLKSVLTSAIFQKATRLSGKARQVMFVIDTHLLNTGVSKRTCHQHDLYRCSSY